MERYAKTRIRKILPTTNIKQQTSCNKTDIDLVNISFVGFYSNEHSLSIILKQFQKYKESIISVSDITKGISINCLTIQNIEEFKRAVSQQKSDFIFLFGESTPLGYIGKDGLLIDFKAINDAFLGSPIHIGCILLIANNATCISTDLSKTFDFVIASSKDLDEVILFDFTEMFFSEYFCSNSISEAFEYARNSLNYSDTAIYSLCLYKKDDRELKDELGEDIIFSPHIAPSNLPISSGMFVGRKSHLDSLLNCWNKSKKVNLVSISAWGGAGKTALLCKFRALMAEKNWLGATRVFDWSFSKQGLSNEYVISSDTFFDNAYKWFSGYTEACTDNLANIDKARYLLDIIRREKTLLLLDGIETLIVCNDDSTGLDGYIIDEAMDFFLRGIADYNPGLCVLTTRGKIKNIENYEGTTCLPILLQPLDYLDTQDLFSQNGLLADESTCRKIHAFFQGHALSIQLAISLIIDSCNGNANEFLKKQNLSGVLSFNDRVNKLLSSYEKWYGDDIYICILRLLSVFDEAVSFNELNELIKEPLIDGLTRALQENLKNRFGRTINQLKENGLLIEILRDEIVCYDVHPIIRGYYRKQLIDFNLEAYTEANLRLYYYYKSISTDKPKTFEEYRILFKSMTYGCRAGAYKDVYNEIYLPRIKQHEPTYDQRKLGGKETNIEAVSGFFKNRWDTVVDLDLEIQHDIFSEVGFALRCLGEFEESIVPSQKAVEMAMQLKRFDLIAIAGGNLSELYLLQGNIDQAYIVACDAVSWGTKADFISRHIWAPMVKKADILCAKGCFSESMILFDSAEKMQREYDSDAPLLYGVLSFKKYDNPLTQYEDEILIKKPIIGTELDKQEAIIELQQIENKIISAFEHDRKSSNVLHYAADMLSLSRVKFLISILSDENPSGNKRIMDQAVASIIRSARKEYLNISTIHQIKYSIYMGDLSKAEILIENALINVTKHELELHKIDLLIERINLMILKNELDKFTIVHDIKNVAERCKKIGYYKRKNAINTFINWAKHIVESYDSYDFETLWSLDSLIQ